MTRLTHKPTDKAIDARDGSKTVSQLAREERAFYDSQPMTAICGAKGCAWSFTGPAAEGRELSRAHREVEHPELISRRERRRLASVDAESEARREIHARAQQRDQVAALERMDAGEPQRPAAPGAARLDPDAREKRTKYTLDSIIAAVQEHAKTNDGYAPAGNKPPFSALNQAAMRVFGLTWKQVAQEAGVKPARTGQGAVKHRKLLESAGGLLGAGPSADSSGPGVVEEDVTGSAAPPLPASPVADAGFLGETGEPPSTSVRDTRAPAPLDPAWPAPPSQAVTPSPRHTWLLILAGIRDLVDIYYPEQEAADAA